jgi:peptidoglycan hydrolase CwlO-like protein
MFRNLSKKIFIPVIIVFFLLSNYNFLLKVPGAPGVPSSESIQRRSLESTEQKLIEDILALDSRVLALKKQVKELSDRNRELKKDLARMRSELSRLNADFKDRQNRLARWIVFSYKGGMGNFLAVLVGAEDMGDFFRRLDNILFFMEYYNNVITETRSLISLRKQEESNIMENQKQVEALEEQAKRALKDIQETLAQKQKELQHARMVLKDTAFLEEISRNWQEALPSLDYLLKNLSKLPWNSISPDNIKVNYFTLTARAEFTDASLTRKLLSGDEKLKNVYFKFHSGGVTVAEKKPESSVPTYSITCALELTEEQKIKFTPTSLEFAGVTLPPRVIQELMSDYDMVFTPPPIPYDLKITSIEIEEGKLIMLLKK